MTRPPRTMTLPHLLAGLALLAASSASFRGAHARIVRGKACVGVPSVTRHEIHVGILAGSGPIRTCYRAALKKKPGLSGKVVVEFRIDPRGRAEKARIVSSDMSGRFERCLLAQFARLRFAPPRHRTGAVIKVKYPFRFSPATAAGAPRPAAVRLEKSARFAVKLSPQREVTIAMPAAARSLLRRTLPRFRLPIPADFSSGAGVPFPFAAVANFDGRPGDDLALVLIHKKSKEWRVVMLHETPSAHQLVRVAGAGDIGALLGAGTGPAAPLFLTARSRCFCGRRCLTVASHTGKGVEYEWDKKKYVPTKQDYLSRQP